VVIRLVVRRFFRGVPAQVLEEAQAV